MEKYIIVGLGVFGRSLALKLIEKGVEVVAADSRMELVEEIQDKVTYAVCMDSTDEKAIKTLGLEDFDVGIVCIGEDFEANLLTAVLFKQNGVKKVIARATEGSIHAKILKAVGIDQVISPGVEAAEKLAYSLVYKSVMDIVYIGTNTAAARIGVPAAFVGKTIGKLNLRARYGVNVVAIARYMSVAKKDGTVLQEEVVNNNPGADTLIEEKDILVVIGDTANLQKMIQTV